MTLYFKKTSTGSIQEVPGATITPSISQFTVTNLASGVLYYFYLDVVGGVNEGRSNVVTVTPLASEPTPTPTAAPSPQPTGAPSPSVTVTLVPSVSVSPSQSSGGGGCMTTGFAPFSVLFLLPLLLPRSRR